MLNGLTRDMNGCDDIFAHIIANQVVHNDLSIFNRKNFFLKEIQKLSYGALQNQVQERIKADEKRIQNELTARRDIMKIKFNLKIENLMFSIAIQSGDLNIEHH